MTLATFAAGALVGLVLGAMAGWTGNGVFRAHLDVKRIKASIPGARQHRWIRIKAALTVVVVAVLAGAVAVAILANPSDAPATSPSPSPSVARR